MPEVPQQNEKNYLTARTGVGDASEIFTDRFARANRDIVRKGRDPYGPEVRLFEMLIATTNPKA
jgi:hypothetical protein